MLIAWKRLLLFLRNFQLNLNCEDYSLNLDWVLWRNLMKSIRHLLFAVLLIFATCSTVAVSPFMIEDKPLNAALFFGVTFGGKTTDEAKLLIDKVKGYTNLFVVDSWDISLNETALDEICEYDTNADLSIIVYFNFVLYNYTYQVGNIYNSTTWDDYGVRPFHMAWLNSARENWGEKFLGIYLYDEPGGKQIDKGHYFGNTTLRTGGNSTIFSNVSSYSDASNRFVRSVSRSGSMQHVKNTSIPNSIIEPMPVFTADNALYWFDYLAGYDTVFAELGWNHNRAQHIAMVRGAANAQNKDWGAIMTWTYDNPPYLASGPEILEDMLTAYEAGAKYVIIFNYPTYPEDNPYGILSEEHFAAMQQFWTYVRKYPGAYEQTKAQVAFVLPKDYGWGMRTAHDNIWGLWPPDDLAPLIWDKMTTLINRYGLALDILYDDPQFNFTEKYSKIYLWNSTTDSYT